MRRTRAASTVLLALATGPALAQEEGEPPAADPADPGDEASDGLAPWFRVDTDSLGLQLWFGARKELGGLGFASNVYLVDSLAELDLGATLPVGDLTLLPMVGVAFDFSTTELANLIAPQLYSFYAPGGVYAESWVYVIWSSPFVDGGEDLFYTRNFVLLELGDTFAIGPQAELSYLLNHRQTGAEMALVSLPVGGRVNVAYGEKNTLGIFLGYETRSDDHDLVDAIAGRFTFIRAW